ncbi:MAG: DMT family transporter, partial [Deltaproteobacteria bacterium]|nr:DMT family transporter [Deltaproteobacteria bacterium]
FFHGLGHILGRRNGFDLVPQHLDAPGLGRLINGLNHGVVNLRVKKISPRGNNRPILLARGIAGTVALTLYFYSLQQMPLVSAATIQYLSPIFTVVIAGLMLKEPPRPVQWIFFLLSMAGVIVLKGYDDRVSVPELLIGITAALASGFAHNFIRMLKGQDNAFVVVFYFPLITVPVIGSYTLFHWVTPHPVEWVVLIAVGLVVTVAQIFMTMGYQAERAANISNLNYLGLVFAMTFGSLFFDEEIMWSGFLGMALIVTSVFLSSRFRQSEPINHPQNAIEPP